jgi:hypothetical protein
MKNLILLSILFLGACTSAIKDDKSEKENPASDAMEAVEEFRPVPTENLSMKSREDMIGYWVGWFEPDVKFSKLPNLFHERRSHRNKINISIDSLFGDSVIGHSVVANNYRPFTGVVSLSSNIYTFRVAEPGDDKHDGKFLFQIGVDDTLIKGYWESYKNVKINRRIFTLNKKRFEYNKEYVLEGRFVNLDVNRIQDSFMTKKDLFKKYGSVKNAYCELWLKCDTNKWNDSIEKMFEGFILEEENLIDEEYLTSSPKIININSSKDSLTPKMVSNLSVADIYILRNSIFARHGYSFKKRDLRNYFDNQDWYIPVHANIRSDITELEKANIKLLLAYEEHAEEYYDSYGR